jgi:hypothetical protein
MIRRFVSFLTAFDIHTINMMYATPMVLVDIFSPNLLVDHLIPSLPSP